MTTMKIGTLELVPAALFYSYDKWLYYDEQESMDAALQRKAFQAAMDTPHAGFILSGVLGFTGIAVVLDGRRRWLKTFTALVLDGEMTTQEIDQAATQEALEACEGVTELINHQESYAVQRRPGRPIAGVIDWR